MKKYIALFTAAAIAAAFTGCSSDKTAGSESDPAENVISADNSAVIDSTADSTDGAENAVLLGGNGESDDNGGESNDNISSDETDDNGDIGGSVMIPNPLIEYETLADAAAEAGFDFAIPDDINGNAPTSYIVINGSGILEVFYGDNAVSLRKAEGSGDISGDFNTYSDVINAEVGDVSAALREKDGKVFSAIWENDGYTYALYSAGGLSEDTATTAISAAK